MFGKSNIELLQKKYDDTIGQLSSAHRTISAMENEIEEYKTTVENMKILSDVEKENNKLKLATLEKSVNVKVNAALASIGVTQFASETISMQPTLTPTEALNKFMALDGEDKTAYYTEHKDLISLALRSKKINQG